MKRIIGAVAGVEYFQRERNMPVESTLSDGNGLFATKLPPNEFALKVIEIIRSEGDQGLRRIITALDGSPPKSFEVPQSKIDSAFESLDPKSVSALELAVEQVRAFQSRALPKSWSDSK
ncbi:MAG: histidinol dehydrogenase, partial [Dehalococcoidia bacterium]|nr:histidinol dehydrogenase [Dehalococcoidia bacterium]